MTTIDIGTGSKLAPCHLVLALSWLQLQFDLLAQMVEKIYTYVVTD
jgi:hypothetical protein